MFKEAVARRPFKQTWLTEKRIQYEETLLKPHGAFLQDVVFRRLRGQVPQKNTVA